MSRRAPPALLRGPAGVLEVEELDVGEWRVRRGPGLLSTLLGSCVRRASTTSGSGWGG